MPFVSPVAAQAVKDDESALAFLHAIAQVLHTWDDLVDKDQPLTDTDVFRAFWLALVVLPENQFYREHEHLLRPVLVNAIINWRIANDFEHGGKEADLEIAFILRSSYVDLLTISASIVGGVEWAISQGPAIRRWAHEEGYAEYLNSLDRERSAREGAK